MVEIRVPSLVQRGFALALTLAAAVSSVQAQAPDGSGSSLSLYERISDARPDGRVVSVSEFRLKRDVFEFEFKGGAFHVLESVAGKPIGAVYLGQGAYTLVPSVEIERRHLASILSDPKLERFTDTFDQAVFFFADETADELVGAGERRTGTAAPAAVQAFDEMIENVKVPIGTNVHLRVLRKLLNDEGLGEGPFYALVRGKRAAKALVAVDSMGVLETEESCLWVDDDDEGGYWYSSHLNGRPRTGTTGGRQPVVDALHYDIDSQVARSTDLSGSTTLHFKVLAPRLRMLPLSLHSTFTVESATLLGETEEAVPFLHLPSGTVALIFPKSLEAGTEAKVRLSYSGDGILEDDGTRIYQVRGRTNWYPVTDPFRDRALYDLTFRVPKGHTVIAVGTPVKTSVEGKETISVWKSEQPISVAGFNYGDFQRYDQVEENTGMALEVYATKGTPDAVTEINRQLEAATEGFSFREAIDIATSDVVNVVNTYTGPSSIGISADSLAEVAMADAINAVQIFTKFFGPLDNPRLAIAQQSQWSFGQAWPSLVYLPYLLGLSSLLDVELGLEGYAGFVDEVGIHEIAHQWWGHKVGWESYRDAWLSEGFAEFSTALVLELTQGKKAYDSFWKRRRSAILAAPTGGGDAHYAAGPIALGFRAETEETPGAAHTLTYSKGGFVLHMLRMMMRDYKAKSDERFFAMMKDFATTYSGQAASTEDFKTTVQKHMVRELDAAGDGKVDWFFEQWVYGNEAPILDADVRVEKVGKGKYRLVGSLSQKGVSDGFLSVVPAYVDFGKGNLAQFGRSPFRGVANKNIDVTLELPKKPKGVVLNAGFEVLAFDG